MGHVRGRKRTVDHEAITEYAKANPTMFQADIAKHFGTTQSRVSHILRCAGMEPVRRGRPLTIKPGQSAEEYDWEQVLHDAGLGMERGLRINNQRVLYGYDPAKEQREDASVTGNAFF